MTEEEYFKYLGSQKEAFGFIGHEKQVILLDKLAKKVSSIVPGVLLFQGNEGIGKKLVAKWFANKVSDKDDVYYLDYDGTQKIDAFRLMFTSLGYMPKNRVCKTYIIDIQKPLSPLIANAILKRLEEMVPGNLVIIVARSEEYLTSTIASRTRKVYFNSLGYHQCKFMLDQCSVKEVKALKYLELFGNKIAEDSEVVEADIALANYVRESMQVLTPYSFIHIQDLAYWMSTDVDKYYQTIFQWAQPYMLNAEWGPKISGLLSNLLDISRNGDNLPDTALWIERAFFKYLGWKVPEIRTIYEKMA